MGIYDIINTSASRLLAAQQAMDVIGQNIANVNTEGYSRQRVNLTTRQDMTSAQISARNSVSTGMSGVEVASVERIKSAYLQVIQDTAVAQQSSSQARATALSSMEKLYNEPGTAGLQSSMDAFYRAWSDLANDPTAIPAGVAVLGAGTTLASHLNALSTGVSATWSGQLTSMVSAVSQANSAAVQVAALNGQISAGLSTGQNVNILLDQRDLLVGQLAGLVGGVSKASADGTVSVVVGGVAIVSGIQSLALSVGGAPDILTADADPVTMLAAGFPVVPPAGAAAGLLAALNTDLPTIKVRLDEIAQTMRDVVNSIQGQGFTVAGDAGGDFFYGDDAATLGVAISSASDLAVSAIQGAADGSNAQKIADLATNSIALSVIGSPGPSELWQNLTYTTGAQIKDLNTAVTTQTAMVAAAKSAVSSESGVNLDEELAEMLQYQRSYQAASKVISIVDEMLQTLIGIVR